MMRVLCCLLTLLILDEAYGFTYPVKTTTSYCKTKFAAKCWQKSEPTSLTTLFSQKKEYSTEVRLREEAEAPFRKVRFFIYSSLLAGCVISLLVSLARIAAGLNGINVDHLDESLQNAAIDVGGMALLLFLLKSDFDAQESRLKRASKGGEMASLPVRGKADFFKDSLRNQFVSLTLSSFRADRGIDKRIVICAAGEDKITTVIDEIRNPSLQGSLVANDLVVIPVALRTGMSPIGMDDDLLEKECIAIPGGQGWKSFIADEVEEAEKQGVDVNSKGFAIILKKNGRVGQRTNGINLTRMVGEVQDRESLGMDVTNI